MGTRSRFNPKPKFRGAKPGVGDKTIKFGENEVPLSLNLVAGVVMSKEKIFSVHIKDCTLAVQPNLRGEVKQAVTHQTPQITVALLKNALENYIRSATQERESKIIEAPGQATPVGE